MTSFYSIHRTTTAGARDFDSRRKTSLTIRLSNMASRTHARLPPEVNRTLYVRNLPFNISPEEVYDIFGKYGALRQVRLGDAKATKGTAYVTYEDIFDAKHACCLLYTSDAADE